MTIDDVIKQELPDVSRGRIMTRLRRPLRTAPWDAFTLRIYSRVGLPEEYTPVMEGKADFMVYGEATTDRGKELARWRIIDLRFLREKGSALDHLRQVRSASTSGKLDAKFYEYSLENLGEDERALIYAQSPVREPRMKPEPKR